MQMHRFACQIQKQPQPQHQNQTKPKPAPAQTQIQHQTQIHNQIHKHIHPHSQKESGTGLLKTSEAVEKAREAEKTTEMAAKIERSEAKANRISTGDASDNLSSSFEANKGRLPLPVSGGTIVGHYGKYTVSGASKVTLDNKGIDIQGSPGCQAKAVFNGTVSSVFQYAGSYIVMIRHGKYISVYSGLSSVAVSNGSRVSTGQSIGSVGADENGKHVLQFQLRKESSRLNPEAWVR